MRLVLVLFACALLSFGWGWFDRSGRAWGALQPEEATNRVREQAALEAVIQTRTAAPLESRAPFAPAKTPVAFAPDRPQPETREVELVVEALDHRGQPLVGVEVALGQSQEASFWEYPEQSKTNAEGEASFRFTPRDVDAVALLLPVAEPIWATFDAKDPPERITLRAPRLGTLTFEILDANGNLAVDVQIPQLRLVFGGERHRIDVPIQGGHGRVAMGPDLDYELDLLTMEWKSIYEKHVGLNSVAEERLHSFVLKERHPVLTVRLFLTCRILVTEPVVVSLWQEDSDATAWWRTDEHGVFHIPLQDFLLSGLTRPACRVYLSQSGQSLLRLSDLCQPRRSRHHKGRGPW